jgi:hypothetical protein
MRRALLAALLAVAAALTPLTASSATCTTLNIPNPVQANYTAPAGTYCPGPQATVKGSPVIDLRAATINGAGTGYLLKPYAGSNATILTGTITNIAGVALGAVGAGNRATVTINGGSWTNVVSGVLYKTNDGGRLDATLTGVTATGTGAGIRTYGSVTLTRDTLTGGGNPSSGDPAAGHALDLNTTGTPVADQYLTATGNILRGFTTTTFQGDALVGEETVTLMTVQGNTIGGVSDADVDSKAAKTVVVGNRFDGAAGVRQVDAHTGRLYSVANTYIVPAGAYGVQATAGWGGPDPQHPARAGLTSDSDTFTLASGANVARATVACTGSTGFDTPRAGVIELINATWTPAGGTPWIAPATTCASDGLRYVPQVIATSTTP